MKSIIQTLALFSFLMLSFNTQAQLITCSNDGSGELDFLLGDWEFFTKDGELLGENHIKLVIGTCTIEENYEDINGFKSRSVMSYDAEHQNWSQIWTDEFGTTLHFNGTFKNNKLTMKAVSISNQGKKTYHQVTYTKNTNGTIHQIWKKSTNQKEWETVFRGTYKHQKAVL